MVYFYFVVGFDYLWVASFILFSPPSLRLGSTLIVSGGFIISIGFYRVTCVLYSPDMVAAMFGGSLFPFPLMHPLLRMMTTGAARHLPINPPNRFTDTQGSHIVFFLIYFLFVTFLFLWKLEEAESYRQDMIRILGIFIFILRKPNIIVYPAGFGRVFFSFFVFF